MCISSLRHNVFTHTPRLLPSTISLFDEYETIIMTLTMTRKVSGHIISLMSEVQVPDHHWETHLWTPLHSRCRHLQHRLFSQNPTLSFVPSFPSLFRVLLYYNIYIQRTLEPRINFGIGSYLCTEWAKLDPFKLMPCLRVKFHHKHNGKSHLSISIDLFLWNHFLNESTFLRRNYSIT